MCLFLRFTDILTKRITKKHYLIAGKQKVRMTPSFRKVVDKETFVRYEKPELHAMASFGFLENESAASSSSDDAARGRTAAGPVPSAAHQKQSVPPGGPGGDRRAKGVPADDRGGKGRPANRTVQTLKGESRKDETRLSTSSPEAAPLGGDLSLSDSCAEDYSSSGSSSKV